MGIENDSGNESVSSSSSFGRTTSNVSFEFEIPEAPLSSVPSVLNTDNNNTNHDINDNQENPYPDDNSHNDIIITESRISVNGPRGIESSGEPQYICCEDRIKNVKKKLCY